MSKSNGGVSRRKHSAKIKFQVVLESFNSDKSFTDIARSYGITSNLITNWRKEFLKNGFLVFENAPGAGTQRFERKIEELEQIIGRKEVEIELLKKFLGNLRST